jgi:hypothetical protein
MGDGGDQQRRVVRGPPARGAGRGRSAVRGAPRRVPRPRRHRAARPPLQFWRLDPAREGDAPRGAAGRHDERRAAAGDPRRAAASGGAGLHRRPQRQVALADHPAGAAVRQLLPDRGVPAFSTLDRTGERRLGDRIDARRVAGQLGDLLPPRRGDAAGGTGDGAGLGGGGKWPGWMSRRMAAGPGRRRTSARGPAGPGASGRRRSTSPRASTRSAAAPSTTPRRLSPAIPRRSGTSRGTRTTPGTG